MNSKNKLCAMFLASLLVVFTGIVIASSPVVDVGDGQIDTIGTTTTVNITLNEAPNGLSGYNLTVSLSKPSIAEIISVSYPSWATLHDNSTLPADSIWMKAADLLEQVESGATNINLGALTFRGDEEGTSDILITVTKMDDDKGYPINPSIDPGHLRVGEAPEPELSYSPTSHDFGDMCEGVTDSTTFEIWNSGTGTLTYSLSESCGWVEVNPTSGSSTGEHNTITVDIDTTGLFEGLHTCDITINSNGGTGTFTVRVNIVPKPDLVILEKWLCWPDNCTICYNVTNTGNGTAPLSHNTTLYVDGVEVAHDHVPVDLAPGESYIGCFDDYTWAYTPPSDNITVCADNNEVLDELGEDNNCLTNIWMCGDVTGDGRVRTSDGRRIFRHLTFGDPIDNMWAADVTGDGRVRTSDGRRIFRHLTFGDPLNCNCSG